MIKLKKVSDFHVTDSIYHPKMENLKNFKSRKILIQLNYEKKISIFIEEPGLTVAWLNNAFFKAVMRINDFSAQRKKIFFNKKN